MSRQRTPITDLGPSALAAQIVGHLSPLCTVAEAAETFRCSTRNIRRWISSGRLPSLRVVQASQARVLIPRDAIRMLIADSLGAGHG
jgi:excisionase family DNA binding protein